MPLYRQIKDRILQQIASGDYKRGDMLPSERQMCRIHDVSHITVRQALVELTQEGVLFRMQGKGTYVGGDGGERAAARTVGLVIPDTRGDGHSPFITDLLAGITSVTGEHRISLSIYAETEPSYIMDAVEGRIQGAIFLVPHVNDRVIPMLSRQRLPLVVVGAAEVPGVYTVDNDNAAIGEDVTAHLIERGHTRIAFIGGPGHFTVTASRLAGYRKALQKAGLVLDERLERFGPYQSETGSRYAPELVAQRATALVCGDDTIALGALSALHTLGRRIPEDVAVAGCNNSSFTRHTWPPITTVDTFPARIGRRSAEVLMQVLRGDAAPTCEIIPAELVVRESTGLAVGVGYR